MLLVACVAYPAMVFYAGHSANLARGYRLIGLVAVEVAVMLVLVAALMLVGVGRRSAYQSSALVGFISFTGLSLPFDGWPNVIVHLMVGAAATLAVVLLNSFRRGIDIGFVILLVMIGTVGPIQLAMAVMSRPPPSIETVGSSRITKDAVMTPDVWFVVVDGYPAGHTMASELGISENGLVTDLRGMGFVVNPNTLSPYAMTHLSIPAMLDLRYPAEDGLVLTISDAAVLEDIVGGESATARFFDTAGYHSTMVESGWHFSRCGENVDTCVRAPMLDEMAGVLLDSSIAHAVARVGKDDAFHRGAVHSLNWLSKNAGVYSRNGRPDFVFVHVLAPHAPYFFDAQCGTVESSPATQGMQLDPRSVGPANAEDRWASLAGQVACVDDSVASAISQLSPEDVVMVAGDHGTDSLGQVVTDPEAWTTEMIAERLLTFSAIRLPRGCGAEIIGSMDLMPETISCLTGEEVAPVAPRSFIVTTFKPRLRSLPVTEVTNSDLARLLQTARG